MPNRFFGQNLLVENRKMNIPIEFCIFELVLVPNFSLNWQFTFFGPYLPKKVISSLNQNSEYHLSILHVQINLNFKSKLKVTILIFWAKFAQKVFSVEKGKSELDYWILQIWKCLGTKFQLKLTNLILLTKFVQKGYSRSKTEKLQFCVRPWLWPTILTFSARGPTDNGF